MSRCARLQPNTKLPYTPIFCLLPHSGPPLNRCCRSRPAALVSAAGRPPVTAKCFFAIYYILVTGMQWKALPRCLGATSTVHDRFQQWAQAGVFKRLWTSGLVQL
ncbi:transposase, partial [Hymenobacter sp. IS2118]|uniref:transposase n=1 Tax=Hymenobacter sp. IS2118 TaxID=1505605 RepID=UPI001268C4C1